MQPPVFSPDHFRDPDKQFRPMQIVHGLDNYLSNPNELTGTQSLDNFLERLARLGTGGIVTNVGFKDYLENPRQWDVLRHGMQKAAELGLHLWVYDEKGYPSGTAGGLVTRANPDFAALGLACYPFEFTGPQHVQIPMPVSCRKKVWVGALRSTDQATPANALDLNNSVDEWGVLHWEAPVGNWTVLYLAERIMYEGTHSAANVCEFKHYINTLDAEAVKTFLRVTHEAYYRELPKPIWDKIEAVFTDEPSFMTYYMPALPDRFIGKIPVFDKPVFTDRPMAVPWLKTFLEEFVKIKGYDLLPRLFALFYSESDDACHTRQDYYEVVTQLYARAFFGQIQDWCHAHGIASSGHVLLEESIIDHVPFEGSLFAVIRKMDLPGIDMLNSDPKDMLNGGSFMGESFMAVKQVSSAAHLAGSARVHSESSDWEQQNQGRFATLAERRGQANLQYVLGVNTITSYFGWDEIGQAGQQAYNDYVGRLGSLLTGGQHICDAAVLYPIRSLWAHYLPPLHPFSSWSERTQRSPWAARVAESYQTLVKQLLCHQIDLDIIDEEAIISGEIRDGALYVAGEAYRVILLPGLSALGLEAAQSLPRFCKSGGVVFSVGKLPRLAESAEKTLKLHQVMAALAATGQSQTVEPEQVVSKLRRSISSDLIVEGDHSEILYTHRVLEGQHVYFITNNAPGTESIQLKLRQGGSYQIYNPLNGEIVPFDGTKALDLQGYSAVFLVNKV